MPDQIKILQYILRYYEVRKIGREVHDILMKEPTKREYNIWSVIQNNDRIVEASPDQVKWITKPPSKEIKRNPELPCLLKELYDFKCQICGWDFKPDYGQAYSETHHIIWLSRGGVDHSNNLIVVCPNHHRIIHETRPNFDRQRLAFVYPNGHKENLGLTDHFKEPKIYHNIELWAKEREKNISKELNLDDYRGEAED
jgi:5-methylcytosine-specific restriction endonuclease McrA